LLRANVAAGSRHAWWLKFGRIDPLGGAILGVSGEISQISNHPGLDGHAYSCSDIWWNSGNRVFIFPILYFKTLYSFRPQRLLIPASNMKLATTAAALDTFGKDYQFVTKAGLYGDDLVIVGSGNPILGDAVYLRKAGKGVDDFFVMILAALRKQNVTEIKGDLLLETSLFDDNRFHPSWNIIDADKWYTTQVSALPFRCW